MRRTKLCLTTALLTSLAVGPALAQQKPHNVILFIADGLRAGMMSPQTTPTMAALAARGVRFANPHSIFPTFTTANAASMATGHTLGDNGDFSNTIYSGFPVGAAGGAVTPFLESNPVLGEVDAGLHGNYLNEATFMQAARGAGIATASIGKVGPVLIFDHLERTGEATIIIDDQTGRPGGIPVTAKLAGKMTELGLGTQAPTRGDNGPAGNSATPGTRVANIVQQGWFGDVATKAVLPMLAANPKGFAMVYWSRDPDGSQHNQGDSLNTMLPGINGPTSLAAIRNADNDLAKLLSALHAMGLDKTTDVIVTADHGFSTISKESATSYAAKQSYGGVVPGFLPPGFVALDLAHGLGMKLFDPNKSNAEVAANAFPSNSNGLIGATADAPQVVVAANGGSDLVYLPTGDRDLARRVVKLLAGQDYVSGLFVDEKFGAIAGTLPLSAIGLKGSAVTPTPSIVINFRTYATGCAIETNCGVEVADTVLQHGQGMHGSFSRADTENTMLAAGPDFREGFVDPAPVSNADLGKTIVRILGLHQKDVGHLVGRSITEAMPNGGMVRFTRGVTRSTTDEFGNVTAVAWQDAEGVRYYDAAGYPGRTLGLGIGK